MNPFPGTEVYKIAKEGIGGLRIIETDWDAYKQLTYGSLENDGIPLSDFKKLQSKAYYTFFKSRPLKALKFLFSDQGYQPSSIPKLMIYGLKNLLKQ
ncbi:MAG TPA: hypothetical protein EYP22_08735 [Methanosarcinales archaeon]|nr:hypothetical protein [Methanosarcinales archaeon]